MPPPAARGRGEGSTQHAVAMAADTRQQEDDMDTISGVLDALNNAGQMMGEELDRQVRRAQRRLDPS